MTQLALDLTHARTAGLEAAQRCLDASERAGFDSQGARRFIVSWCLRHGQASGEELVEAAKAHGFRGKDDRCFGPVFLAALRADELYVIRSDLPRRKGHGTSGARLYGARVR